MSSVMIQVIKSKYINNVHLTQQNSLNKRRDSTAGLCKDGWMGLLYRFFKFDTNITLFSKKTILSGTELDEQSWMNQFIILKMIDVVDKPNF